MYIQIMAVLIVFALIFKVVHHRIVEGRKYNKKLTILKDVGGQTIKEVEFRVKEEQLPLDPDNPANRGWFLVTKKRLGRRYIWPRPPYEHWIADDHIIIYSKSYKGNNYACLVDNSSFLRTIRRVIPEGLKKRFSREYDGPVTDPTEIDNLCESDKVEYAIEDSHGKVHLARFMVMEGAGDHGEDHLGLVDIATESIPVVFPKAAHEIKPLFDERYLSEMVHLHTTMNQIFSFNDWWDKHGALVQAGVMIAIVFISMMFSYKVLQEVKEGPIKHELTVKLDSPYITYENIEPEPPETPPSETPPPGGKFADVIRGQMDE